MFAITFVWYFKHERGGSFVLGAGYHGFKQRNNHGVGDIAGITSGLVMQLLTGSKIIDVDHSLKEDRALLDGAKTPRDFDHHR